MAKSRNSKNEFEAAGEDKDPSLLEEIMQFIIEYKKWWLIPIVLSLAMIGLLVLLSATGAAPFIYTLF